MFAANAREWADILIADSEKSTTRDGCWGRERFTICPDDTAICPAGTRMRGPFADGHGRRKWVGVGCAECPDKPQCTPGRARALTPQHGR